MNPLYDDESPSLVSTIEVEKATTAILDLLAAGPDAFGGVPHTHCIADNLL